MKLIKLRKKILSNLAISGALVIVLGLIIFYDSQKKKLVRDEAEKVEAEVSGIKNKSSELQNKVAQAKKYQEIWKTIGRNKKFIGNIKIDDVVARMNLVAEKYSITKASIKMTVPEDLSGGVFQRTTVTVAATSASLTFESVNDTKALSFVSEFTNSIPGYAVISNFEMSKIKKYTDQDLVQISSGAGNGAIKAKVDFFWYIYKPKAVSESKLSILDKAVEPKPDNQSSTGQQK